MPSRLDPFVDALLRERADQLYLLPDEPVTLIKNGKARKVSKQPLTDHTIHALMLEVAPPEAADKIDHQTETEFEYAVSQGLVRVRIVPEMGRLTAVISTIRHTPAGEKGGSDGEPPPPPPPPPPAKPPRTSAPVTAPRPAVPVVERARPYIATRFGLDE